MPDSIPAEDGIFGRHPEASGFKKPGFRACLGEAIAKTDQARNDKTDDSYRYGIGSFIKAIQIPIPHLYFQPFNY